MHNGQKPRGRGARKLVPGILLSVFGLAFLALPVEGKPAAVLILGILLLALGVVLIASYTNRIFGSRNELVPQQKACQPVPRPSAASDKPAANTAAASPPSVRRPPEPVQIETAAPTEEDSNPTIEGAELSWLDAKALRFWNKKKTDEEIPAYYAESAFGRNVVPARERLLANGLLELGDRKDSIALKTIPELKEVLAEHHLKTGGKKADLIGRLMDSFSEDDLREMFPVGVYRITEAGWKALEPYSIIEDNVSHSLGFSFYQLMQEKKKTPGISNEEIFIRLFKQKIDAAIRSGNRESYRFTLSTFERYLREIGETEAALQCAILEMLMWVKGADTLQQSYVQGESYYIAKNMEAAAQQLGFNLNQLTAFIRTTIQTRAPFGLNDGENIRKVLQAFKKSLSISD